MRKGRLAREQERRKRRRWLTGLALVGLVGLLAWGGWTAYERRQRDRAMEVFEQVLTALSLRRPDECYWMFSARTRATMTRADLALNVDDPERFKSLSYYELGTARATRWRLSTLEAERLLRLIHLEGSLRYQDGSVGAWTAELEREPRGWRVNTFSVEAPPEKGPPPDEPAPPPPPPESPASSGSPEPAPPPETPR